jgi:prepilin-type N-terminal cleavage/methylation domain-containing protein
MKKQSRGEKGFSLVELLVVVGIILIIAAIAIPNLLASRMAANESAAVGATRTLNTALLNYSSQCPQIGFPTDLTALGPGAGDCTGMGAVDETLGGSANPTRGGYTFTYAPISTMTAGYNDRYTINADPVSQDTGTRHFFTDYSGVIRYNSTSSASANDNVVD